MIQPPFKSNARSRYVELLIVNDNKEASSLCGPCIVQYPLFQRIEYFLSILGSLQFIKMKRNKEAVFERSKQIANVVNAVSLCPIYIFFSYFIKIS